MNRNKTVIARPAGLMTSICCVLLSLFIFGCAGRAESTIDYAPPNPAARDRQPAGNTVILGAGTLSQAKAAVKKFLQSVFPEQLNSAADGDTLTIMAVIPPDKLERFLDCGRFSVLNPDSHKEAATFAATQRQTDFPLSDATSFPKPAQRTMEALAKINVLFTPDGPHKTGVTVRTAFAVRQELIHYTLVQGFSPMMPYRLSQRIKEDDSFTFDSGETGQSATVLPQMRYCIKGSFTMQCASTGSLEKELIQGIKNIKIGRAEKGGQ